MRVWEGIRLFENIVCKSPEDLFLLIQEALRLGRGVLVRIFSKDERSAYVHLLFDEEKLLLAEVVFIRTGGRLRGESAIRYLLDVLSFPVIADVYSLGDEEVKRTVLSNLELYEETPHVLLFELFSPKLWQSSPTSLKSDLLVRSLE
ncbi:hypothetical protein TAM4_426 [Thermococcus sp. AM4]|nr:hypothetical protein TAM4_426 [Thermococcus sp. AM4]